MKTHNFQKNLFILTFFFIIYIGAFWGTGLLFSGFRFYVDDHQIVNMYYDLQNQSFSDTMTKWLAVDYQVGRFRPLYMAHAVIITKIFGLNSFLWFSYYALLATLTTFFLFLFSRLLKNSIPESLLFSILICLGAPSIMWARLGVPEGLSTLLLSASLIFAVRGSIFTKNRNNYNIFFIALLILASLTKESFILFMPAVALIKIWTYREFNAVSWMLSLKQNTASLGIIFVSMILEILYIKYKIGTNAIGYAGVDGDSFNLTKILTTVIHIVEAGNFYIMLFALGMIIIYNFHKKQFSLTIFKPLIPVALIFFVGILPQAFLYAKSGIYGYYLTPALIVYYLILFKSIGLLKTYSKTLSSLLIVFLLIITFNKLAFTWNNYTNLAMDSKMINSMLQKVQSCTPRNESILIVVNPRVHYEMSYSLKRVLNYAFKRDNLLLATFGTEKTDFYSTKLQDIENFWSFLDPSAISKFYENKSLKYFTDKNEIKAIIIFDSLDNDFEKISQSWFLSQNYQKTDFQLNPFFGRLYCKQ